MKIFNSIKGLNVVITGASSGNGKAIALMLAKHGANLVLASRRETLLQEVASECEGLGGSAVAVETDVTIPEDVKSLFEKSLDQLGSIDVWINDAGVLAAGAFDETPLGIHQRVIETNLLGQLYGLYEIIPHFKRTGQGIVINIVSLSSFIPTPFATAYSASKYGLRGLADALRFELTDYPRIRICNVHPSFVDTPGINRAANFTHHELRPAPPLYDPFQVAGKVRSLILNPRDNVMVGATGRLGKWVRFLSPTLIGLLMAKAAHTYFKNSRHVKETEGNLFEPFDKNNEARGGNMKRPSVLKKYYDVTLGLS